MHMFSALNSRGHRTRHKERSDEERTVKRRNSPNYPRIIVLDALRLQNVTCDLIEDHFSCTPAWRDRCIMIIEQSVPV